jgi:ATP-dependent RNA helicase DDX35
MHPVDVFYLQSPVPDYVIGVVDAISKIHQSEPSGDILAFLTGQDEVDRVVDIIKEKATSGELTSKYLLKVFPLYSALPYELQANVFQPVRSHVRKVIVATNVAETSVTIPNIVYVVDCGFAKFKAYDPLNGVETLVVAPISRASAIQRAGRAGRVKAGKVFRLYTENSYRSELPARTPPAMQRTDLAQICLQLKALGVDNIARFDFLSPPTPDALIRSLDLLYSLGAIDDTCQLTSPLGLYSILLARLIY